MNIEGTTNANAFIYFLCPILKIGDIVVIDNAAIHKNEEIQTFIEKNEAISLCKYFGG